MPEPQITDQTLEQLKNVRRTSPHLIVCDVDEVLLHFVAPLETYMAENGYVFRARSYGLTGNIVDQNTGEFASQSKVGDLIHRFFKHHKREQKPVENAANVLNKYAKIADVVLLTNMPFIFRQARVETLNAASINHFVVTNEGPKGPAAAYLAQANDQTVVFIDDSPRNLLSVKRSLPQTHLIQFMADTRFFASMDKIDGVELRSNHWAEVDKFLGQLFPSHL